MKLLDLIGDAMLWGIGGAVLLVAYFAACCFLGMFLSWTGGERQ